MTGHFNKGILALLGTTALLGAGAAQAGVKIDGRVEIAHAPVAGSKVTLWSASAGTPQRLGEAVSGPDGGFSVNGSDTPSAPDYYITAEGGTPAVSAGAPNPAIALISVLGTQPPVKVVVNEMTTVASVWTNRQFLSGKELKGYELGLRIAAANPANFVDPATGGWGGTIQDPLNSGQTPTMANFATLADAVSACAARVTPGACGNLFAAAQGPAGAAPTDTLGAAEAIAGAPWYKPERLFNFVETSFPKRPGEMMRTVPFMPHLNTVPSAWVLPLKFDGGGYRAGGKAMFDSKGNLWVGDNFTVGWQGHDTLWEGNFSEFAPDGRPISPITTGFAGGGFAGGTFGAAVDANDNVWLTSYGGHSISKFDNQGRSLAGPGGITFGGKLGLMQGVIVTPSSDVWVVGISKNQLVHIPDGDPAKAKLVCEGFKEEPCKSFLGPFHLGVDQQDRIWVTSALGDHVTRFPASDPTKVETFKTGFSGSGLGVDSQGNVWVTNRFGNQPRGGAVLEDMIRTLKSGGNFDRVLALAMAKQTGGLETGGSVALLRPDGTPYPGSPFTGGGLPGPWAATVDGDDNVWVSNFAMPNSPIVELCGVKTQNCPPGFKTGDQISPPGGYVGGGLQMQTDLAVGPAGDVWVMDNWEDINACFAGAPEAISTRCGGQGVTVFFGMAKPVRAPQIGPARLPWG